MSDKTVLSAKAGDEINLSNTSSDSVKYEIDCGEYGVISFTGIIGSTATIKVGTIAPTITILDSDGN